MTFDPVRPDRDGDVLGRRRKFSAASASAGDNDPQTFAIIGAAMEVHRELGSGFLEVVYQDALQHELRLRNIPFVHEHSIPIAYKGIALSSLYRADFLCFDRIVVELKAQKSIGEVEDAQVLHYLKATSLKRALLINFGAPSLQFKRLVRS